MPKVLAGLRDPARHRASLRQLGDVLAREGRVYSASAPVLRELVILAKDAGVPNRSGILELAIWIVTLGDPPSIDFTGIDLGITELAKRYGTAEAKAVLEVASGAVRDVLTLAGDASAEVRAVAAHFLGIIPQLDAVVIDALKERLAVESSVGCRVSLLLALAMHGRNEPTLAPRIMDAIRQHRRTMPSPELVAGVAAACETIALRALPEDVSVDDLSKMFLGLAPLSEVYVSTNHDLVWARSVSWKAGRVDLIVTYGLTRACDDVARMALVESVARAVARAPLVPFSALRAAWPNVVLETCFERRQLLVSPVALSDLDARQRRLIGELSVRSNDGAYAEFGLPPDVRSRRRVLHLDPPGVMEQELPNDGRSAREPCAVWRLAALAVDEWKRSHPGVAWNLEAMDVHAFFRERGFGRLPNDQWLDLWMEMHAAAYGLMAPAEMVLTAIDGARPAERQAFASRWAPEIRRWPEELSSRSWLVFRALASVLSEGASYPEDYDEIFTFYGFPDDIPRLFERIPEVRREQIARREIERSPGVVGRLLAFEHLAPRAAEELKRRQAAASK